MIGSILLAGSLIVGCGLALILSMYAGMITDKCSVTRHCSDSLIYAAYLVAWGGMGAAVLVTVVGMGRSALTRRPLLGWVLLVITFATGGLLLSAGVGG